MTQPSQAFAEYFEALARLKAGRPVNVMKGTKITNDAVALEARRGKGSIKKSRPAFLALIQAIDAAAAEQANSSPEKQQKAQLQKIKGAAHQYRNDLDAVTSSLVARLYEVYELKKKVHELEEKVETLTEQLSRVSHAKVQAIKPKHV